MIRPEVDSVKRQTVQCKTTKITANALGRGGAAIFRRRVRPHDAADVPLAVEHAVVVVRPLAARAGFGGAFEGEHGAHC
jgi:hypothetical protein